MNETVAKLERSGHLERKPHPVHRHVRESRLTGAGQQSLATADALAPVFHDASRGVIVRFS